MIHYEKTDISIERRIGKLAGAIIVDDTRDFVSERAKTKDVGNGVVVDIVDKVEVWIGI